MKAGLFHKIVFGCIAACMLAVPAMAQVPLQISYQGLLTYDSGDPVADGNYAMTFALYNVPSGGTLLWSESQTVSVTGGIYNVVLGSLGNPIDAAVLEGERYLGVKVGTDAEMIPRQPLTAAPFAIRAALSEDAGSLDGMDSSEFAPKTHSHTFGEITDVATDAQIPDTITVNHAAHADDAEYAGNADKLDGMDASNFATALHTHNFSELTGNASDAQIPNDITIEYAAQAGNADKVDGQHAADFMAAGTDNWVNTTGDTMNGRLEVSQLMSGAGWGEAIKGILYTESDGAGVFGLSNGTDSHGVHGGATGINGVGVYGEVTGSNGIGVFGNANNTTNGIGLYGSGPLWAGYFAGNIYTSGEIHIPSNSQLVNATGNPVFHTGWSGLFGDYTTINSGYAWGSGEPVSVVAGANGVFFTKGDALGVPYSEILAKVDTAGKLTCAVLEITGGSDLAEPFETHHPDPLPAGSVMVIDPDHPGKLKLSQKAYDRRVAGIVSGAGGIDPGMLMYQRSSTADGTTPIALSGRVYCLADATGGPIQPGDLLTTSELPGHAMKVTDYEKSHGATLGKAMSALERGQGLVLVLVGLQ